MPVNNPTSHSIYNKIQDLPLLPKDLTKTHVVDLISFINSKDPFTSSELITLRRVITSLSPSETSLLQKIASRITNLSITLFQSQFFLTSKGKIQKALIPEALRILETKLRTALSEELQASLLSSKKLEILETPNLNSDPLLSPKKLGILKTSNLNINKEVHISLGSQKKTRFQDPQPSINADSTGKVPTVEGSTTVNLEATSPSKQEEMKTYLADIISRGNSKNIKKILKTLKEAPDFKNSPKCVQNLINKIIIYSGKSTISTDFEGNLNTYSGYYAARFAENHALEEAAQKVVKRPKEGPIPPSSTQKQEHINLAKELRTLLQPIDENTLSRLCTIP